jgi:hypothetical protein
MAKVLTYQTHGSVGPVTTQSGRFGTIQRARVTPINPKSLAQQNQRSILGAVASEWRGLTEAQRLAWRALANQVSGNLTGFMMYVKLNSVLVTCGVAKDEDPPLIPAFGIISCTGLTSVAGVLKLVAVVDTVMPDKFMIEAAPQVSAGIENVSSKFRLIKVVAGHTASADIDISTAYVAKFGELIAGQKVTARITPMKDGFKGIPLAYAAINA